MTEIILKEGKEESLKRFHPWVFSGAIKKICGKAEEGEVVRVADAHGNLLGIGHFQNSSIAVRILSFDDTELTEAYWENRISKAYDVRRSLGLMRDDNNTYRLVHGEGDSLPGLIVDIYDHTAIMQAHSAGMHYARHAIAKAILKVKRMPPAGSFWKALQFRRV